MCPSRQKRNHANNVRWFCASFATMIRKLSFVRSMGCVIRGPWWVNATTHRYIFVLFALAFCLKWCQTSATIHIFSSSCNIVYLLHVGVILIEISYLFSFLNWLKRSSKWLSPLILCFITCTFFWSISPSLQPLSHRNSLIELYNAFRLSPSYATITFCVPFFLPESWGGSHYSEIWFLQLVLWRNFLAVLLFKRRIMIMVWMSATKKKIRTIFHIPIKRCAMYTSLVHQQHYG